MTIQLNPEQENIAGQAIRAGLIKGWDEVAEVGLASIRERLKTCVSAGARDSAEEWVRALAAWSEGHAPSTPLLADDAIGRESIYGTRGA